MIKILRLIITKLIEQYFFLLMVEDFWEWSVHHMVIYQIACNRTLLS